MLYAALLAAGVSLITVLVAFPATANGLLANKLCDTLGTSSELLLASLHLYQVDIRKTPEDLQKLKEQVSSLRKKFASQVAQLRPAYEEAKYEITYSRFPMQRYDALIAGCQKLENLLVSRTGLTTTESIPRERHNPNDLRSLVDELGTIHLACINHVRTKVAKSTSLGKILSVSLGRRATDDVGKLNAAIEDAVAELKDSVVEAMDSALRTTDYEDDDHTRLFQANVSPAPGQTSSFTYIQEGRQAFRDCFFLTSLVELSGDISQLLLEAEGLPEPGDGSSRRFWFPALSMALFASKQGETDNVLDAGGSSRAPSWQRKMTSSRCAFPPPQTQWRKTTRSKSGSISSRSQPQLSSGTPCFRSSRRINRGRGYEIASSHAHITSSWFARHSHGCMHGSGAPKCTPAESSSMSLPTNCAIRGTSSTASSAP